MAINAEISKSGNETALSTIRKFSRRVQGTGLIRTVRGGRYHTRTASKIVKKKRALKLIKRRADYKQLIKEGKVVEAAPRHGQGSRPSYRSPQTTEQSSVPKPAETTPIVR